MKKRFNTPTAFLSLIGFAVVLAYMYAAIGGFGPSITNFKIMCWMVVVVVDFLTASGVLIVLYELGVIAPKPDAKHLVWVYMA